MKNIFFALLIIASSAYPQKFTLTGTVADSAGGRPLSFASVRIGGTHYGTSSNLDGDFVLKLEKGNYNIIFSYIGYRSDTMEVNIPNTSNIFVALSAQSIVLPEVVVNDEDPAYRIIREAIKRKVENREGLYNFEYDAYSKKIINSAGDVAIIEETFVKGYNKIDEWEKEFLKSSFKTENMKNQVRSMDFTITDKYFVDFSRDTLSLFMNVVYLPLAQNAFDFYEYKLLKTTLSENVEIYEIELIPKSKIQPLLEGKITIDSEDYALNSVDLKTNEGVRFPYINHLKADFKQNLNKTFGYWLPRYVEYRASVDINIQGLIKIGTMEFNQISNITNYIINPPIPDSIENAQRSKYGFYTVDTSENEKKPVQLSKSEIESLREIPLTQKEVAAFETLDSTKTMDKLVKVEGALASLIPESDDNDTSQSFIGDIINYTTSYLEYRNNRVTGLLLGLKYNDYIVIDRLFLNAAYGYSFERETSEGDVQISYRMESMPISDIRFRMFSCTNNWQVFTPYPDIVNSIGVTFGSEDHFNYYLSRGYSIGIGRSLEDKYSVFVDYKNESQSTLAHNKYRSLISADRYVRPNPEIVDGDDIKGSITVSLGKNPLDVQVIPENGLAAQLDFSSPNLKSDFNYQRYRVVGMLKISTFFNELFISPYMQLFIDASIIKGEYGPQHIFTPITALSFYSPLGSFKGLKPYQYTGTEMVSTHLEHNWRSILFQAAGLDFISDLHLDFITGFSGLKIWNDSEFLNQKKINNDYWEAYLSVSRIFALARIDISYSSLKKFTVSASIGVLL